MIYRLENKTLLILLLLVPLLIGLWWLFEWIYKARINRIGDKVLTTSIFPSISSSYSLVKYLLMVCVILFIIIAAVNPQSGKEEVTTKTVGLEINFIVDVSNSMLATDLKPSRMEVARQKIMTLINAVMPNKIGITVFAGEAFNQLPPTTDPNVIDAIVSTLSPANVPTQGSNLKEAFEVGYNNFSKEKEQKKIIVFISDGESHEEGFLEKGREAFSSGINIFTIGVGTKEGGTIPITLPNGKKALLKEKNGKVVKTILNESSLSQLAEAGGGSYTNIQDEAGIESIVKTINSVPKKIIREKSYEEFSSYFQYFIFVALIILLAEFFMPVHKLKRKKA